MAPSQQNQIWVRTSRISPKVSDVGQEMIFQVSIYHAPEFCGQYKVLPMAVFLFFVRVLSWNRPWSKSAWGSLWSYKQKPMRSYNHYLVLIATRFALLGQDVWCQIQNYPCLSTSFNFHLPVLWGSHLNKATQQGRRGEMGLALPPLLEMEFHVICHKSVTFHRDRSSK